MKKWGEENKVKDAPRSGASCKITKEIKKESYKILDTEMLREPSHFNAEMSI